MKHIVLLPLAATLLLTSCSSPKWQETETENGFNVITQKKGQTIAYSPESGISILTVDGYAFKDLNRNGEFEENEVYVFYTHNHYNDFREYLNYYGGWGEIFGNITGGGMISSKYNYTNIQSENPLTNPSNTI